MVTCLVIASLAADVFAQTRGHRARVNNGESPSTVARSMNAAGVCSSSSRHLAEPGCRMATTGTTPRSGAAGRWGGPAAALLLPGLPLGGRLPPHASGGGRGHLTGVFVNGRELHPGDVRAMIAIYGQVWPGRWWVNGLGDFGPEGGPAIGNLRARPCRGNTRRFVEECR